MLDFLILRDLSGVRPAPSPETLAQAQAELPIGLNAQLAALYEACDGFLADAGTTVYHAGGIVERNTTFQVAEYAPGFVLFGDDSGGRGFLLHARTPDSPVYASDMDDMDPARFEIASADLRSWLTTLA